MTRRARQPRNVDVVRKLQLHEPDRTH